MKTSLRVLHVITTISRGGAENHLLDLVRHQRDSGVVVAVAYLRGAGYWAQTLRDMEVEVHALGLRFYGDPRALLRLWRVIVNGGFDLVHAHLPPAELYTRLALLGTNEQALPLIISKHNDCPFHDFRGERVLGRWVARRAAVVIAISDAVRRYMTGPTLGLAPAQVQTIRYGIEVEPFESVPVDAVLAVRREWHIEQRTLVVGCVGRLVEQKSIDTLIRAFAVFQRSQACGAKLVIVGEGPLESELRRCAHENGVTEHVVWAGFREDMPVVMHAFDVFAITSVFEGFGLVLIEAMAAKRPVVATLAGAIPEVVLDGVTGLLAVPRDAEAVAEALARLSDPAVREQLGAAGCRRVRSHFTLQRMCEETDATYARCLPYRPSSEATIANTPACSRVLIT